MILDNSLPELVDLVDASTLRVHPPSSILFVCGGKIDASAAASPSLRDAFSRVFYERPKFSKYSILMAEDVNAFFPRGKYQDILSFEADIAQIADLIVLFSESFGSAAELGAFAMIDEIALRLLVIIDDFNFSETSFVTLGPLRLLQNTHGDSSICVLHRGDININSITDIGTLDKNVFGARVETAIRNRQLTSKEHSTFDRLRPGHVVKLICGLLQYYGALTLDEIQLYIEQFGCIMSKDRISDLILCAEFAQWIFQVRGTSPYYCMRDNLNEAIQFSPKSSYAPFSKLKWRADVQLYWKNNDGERFSIIQSARKGS